MSLLSGLLDHIPPTVAQVAKPVAPMRAPDRPRPAVTERPSRPQTSTSLNAASATPAWRQARNQYLNHIMVCRSCYSPSGRHCLAGAELRAAYDSTPMESRP